eukprot:CAMPEP_0168196742 /NCGR_PEP_ID=MMETSP0139_2-20121125/20712_1 /TAXON_ID=44445 /ORGANISM="Pseudo-nitzschia australis, Strain 10249 10 AB" /LENGTH=190 /DNA_ID=CAMNT_0008121005 /DNA_START=25 /DNA_END=598 /DNA_ORIENTATION=+
MAQSSTRIEDSRDILKGMIFQEDNYYKCPNYLCLDDNSIQASVSMPVPSLLEIVEEMASLVTDVGNEPSVKTKGNYHCTSPGSSVCDIYGDFEGAQQISLPQQYMKKNRGKGSSAPQNDACDIDLFRKHFLSVPGGIECLTGGTKYAIDTGRLSTVQYGLDLYRYQDIQSQPNIGAARFNRDGTRVLYKN